MSNGYVRISPIDNPEYRERISHVSEAVWPEFMLQDPIADAHWDGLFEDFPAYQFAVIDQTSGAVAGIVNSVPLHWTGPLEELPDGGWDWALIKSASDRAENIHPTVLCALQIAIAPMFQGRGLSPNLLREMISLAGRTGLPLVIAPVRPSFKDRYPLASIDSYISWSREDGLPFDPWLRVHVRLGGRIIKPCPQAMRITGTIAEWESWTGMRFFETGEYIVPGALVPVAVDLDGNCCTYVEPNVWVVHNVPGN